LNINEKSRNFIIYQFSPAKAYLGAVAVCPNSLGKQHG
jgi:hypothetical protein